MRYELYLNRFHLRENGKKDNTSIRIQIYSGREDYSFPFRLVSNPFLKSDCFDRKFQQKFSIRKNKFSPLDGKREREKLRSNVKLFFDSKSITIERNIHLYTFIYDYYPTTDIFLATIELSSYEEYIFLAHSTRPPPHLPRPASWQHHRDDVVTSLFYYSTRGVVDVFAVTLEHVSARLSRVERS